jgi:hypothetical protein
MRPERTLIVLLAGMGVLVLGGCRPEQGWSEGGDPAVNRGERAGETVMSPPPQRGGPVHPGAGPDEPRGGTETGPDR